MKTPPLKPEMIGEDVLASFIRFIQWNSAPNQREGMADVLANIINLSHPDLSPPPIPSTLETLVPKLSRSGISDPFDIFIPSQLDDILTYLKNQPTYNAHAIERSDGVPRTLEDGGADSQYAVYPNSVAARLPHIWEALRDLEIVSIAADYLKCHPRIYSYALSWSFPFSEDETALYESVQTFHRDRDDFRFLSLFIFLSGTTGDHVYAPGTQSFLGTQQFLERLTKSAQAADPFPRAFELGHLYNDRTAHIACGSAGPECYERITPAPGRAFLADPSGLHRGDPPNDPHLMFQVRSGLYPNTAHHTTVFEKIPWSELAARVGDTPETRYMYEMIADI
jgi:hypothetical protein